MFRQIKRCFLLLLGLILVGCTQERESSKVTPPNILFIAVDDLRPELGCYGASHIQSPNIDKLAEESLVFERAYCNIPVCGASRASILSGIRPGWHRFRSYKTYLSEDAPGVVSLPKHFKNHGYETASLGKVYHHSDDDMLAWNMIWDPPVQNASGWRDYLTEENLSLFESFDVRGLPYENTDVPDTAYFDGKIAEQAIENLKSYKASGTPFFLAVGFVKPHLPFNAPSRYWEMYDSASIKLPSNYTQPESTPDAAFHNFGELRHYSGIPKEGPLTDEQAKKLIHGYYACVSYTDAQIGKVLNALKALELEEETIVLLWGIMAGTWEIIRCGVSIAILNLLCMSL